MGRVIVQQAGRDRSPESKVVARLAVAHLLVDDRIAGVIDQLDGGRSGAVLPDAGFGIALPVGRCRCPGKGEQGEGCAEGAEPSGYFGGRIHRRWGGGGGPTRISLDQPAGSIPFKIMRLALNSSTIMGHKLSVPDQIRAAGRGGFTGLEPWVRDLDAHVEAGGSLGEIREEARLQEITLVNLIGFFEWVHDDADRRSKGLAEARRNFHQAAALHCPFVAAPPFGMTDKTDLDADVAAERFAALEAVAREVSRESGFTVRPLLEFWGHSQALGTLQEALAIVERLPETKLLADVFHMYKKGSDHTDLATIPEGTLEVFHINDYPACDDPSSQPDSERVYPGDGIADFATIRKGLADIGFSGWLSLELFNKEYWSRPLETVLSEGLRKSQRAFDL